MVEQIHEAWLSLTRSESNAITIFPDIMMRGDHRVVAVNVEGHNSYTVYFDGPKRDLMHKLAADDGVRLKTHAQMVFLDAEEHERRPERYRGSSGHRGRPHRQQRRHQGGS